MACIRSGQGKGRYSTDLQTYQYKSHNGKLVDYAHITENCRHTFSLFGLKICTLLTSMYTRWDVTGPLLLKVGVVPSCNLKHRQINKLVNNLLCKEYSDIKIYQTIMNLLKKQYFHLIDVYNDTRINGVLIFMV